MALGANVDMFMRATKVEEQQVIGVYREAYLQVIRNVLLEKWHPKCLWEGDN